jgi:putative peptidoglycan lipid II flippase
VSIGPVAISAGIFADDRIAGLPLGPLGLAAGASIGAWLEYALLRGRLARSLGRVDAGGARLARTFAAALAAAAVGYGARVAATGAHPLLAAAVVAAAFGAAYLGVAHALGLEEARGLLDGVARALRLRRGA